MKVKENIKSIEVFNKLKQLEPKFSKVKDISYEDCHKILKNNNFKCIICQFINSFLDNGKINKSKLNLYLDKLSFNLKTIIEFYIYENNYEIEDDLKQELCDMDFLSEEGSNLYLKDISLVSKLLNAEEEKKLFIRYNNGEFKLKDEIIHCNLPLVISIAKRHVGKGLEFLDLVQEGNIGLMTAIDKYDVNKGYKFSTYATWWISQSIKYAISCKSRLIRLPYNREEKLCKLKKYIEEYEMLNGIFPSVEEISSKFGFDYEMTVSLIGAIEQPDSLNRAINHDEDTTLESFIVDKNSSSVEEQAINSYELQRIRDALSKLSAREKDIFERRYGIKDGCIETLDEVAADYNLTRERIRQIQKSALNRVKRTLRV